MAELLQVQQLWVSLLRIGCVFVQMTMPRGVVHACHAGGLVHALEGWEHHEVGAIDVSRIDQTWAAALKHGFKPVC